MGQRSIRGFSGPQRESEPTKLNWIHPCDYWVSMRSSQWLYRIQILEITQSWQMRLRNERLYERAFQQKGQVNLRWILLLDSEQSDNGKRSKNFGCEE